MVRLSGRTCLRRLKRLKCASGAPPRHQTRVTKSAAPSAKAVWDRFARSTVNSKAAAQTAIAATKAETNARSFLWPIRVAPHRRMFGYP
jgi:hypothetical protein